MRRLSYREWVLAKFSDLSGSSVLKLLFVIGVSLRFSFLPHSLFKDRDNYLIRLENSEQLFLNSLFGEVNVLLSEPLFASLNYIMGNFFDPSVSLSVYVFVNTFVVLFYVIFFRKHILYSVLAVVLLAVVPYFYGATLGAIRQGLGFNIVIFSLMRKERLTSKFFLSSLFLASLFHVIFYVFFSLVLFYKVILLFTGRKTLILAGSLIVVSVIGGAWRLVSPYLSSKHHYESFEATTTGTTFLGWAFIFCLFLYNYFYIVKRQIKIYDSVYFFAALMFIIFLVFYWFVPSPYRIFYSFSPLLVCSIMINFNKYAAICYLSVFLYGVVLIFNGAASGSMTVTFGEFLKVLFFG